MNKKIVLLAVFAAIFLSVHTVDVHAAGNGNCTGANYASQGGGNFSVPPSGDNWTINNTVVCSQVLLNLTNLTITSTGSLTLNKSVVIFNITSNAPLQSGINVSGSLYLNNGTNITTNRTDYGFSFFFYAGSSGWINDSNISQLQNHTGWGSNGIFLNTSNVILITNSFITDSRGYGLNIVGGSPVINNTTIKNNPGGVLVVNSTPTLVNLTIKVATDAALNATYANGTIFNNNTLINNTYGLVFSNTNLTMFQLQINNSTYGLFAKNTSLIYLFDSNITENRINGGARSASVYFNPFSNASNVTFVNILYGNYTFIGNNTANFTENWYVDLYVRSRTNNTLVQGANVYINNTTIALAGAPRTTAFSFDTNASGTFPRINLTHFISYFNSSGAAANITLNFSNYDFNATKGNSSGFNISVNITNNFINANNITLLLNLSTLMINVKGTGAALGFSVQNALVSLTNGSSNFTGNTSAAAGTVTIDVPFGYYTINVSSGNYSQMDNTTYFANVSDGSNTSYAVNVTLLPRINITGNYSCGSRTSIMNFTSASNCNNELSSGSQLRYNGTARYAHNNGAVNGTLQVTGSSSTFSVTTYTNLTVGGNFDVAKTATTPDSTTNYTVNFYINDSHGDNGTTTEGIKVTAASSSSSSSTTSSSSGGGGGGGTGDYALTITEYTRTLVLAQGETKDVAVVVKNTGVKSLAGVSVYIAGISSEWYKVNVTGGGSTKDLAADGGVTFNVHFNIPSNAPSTSYKGTWRVRDRDALALAEKDLSLTVSQVWTSDRVNILNRSLSETDRAMADLWKNITILKTGGVNVSDLEANFKALNSTLALAKLEYSSNDYTSSQNDLNRVKADIATLVSALTNTQPKGVGQVLGTALAKPLGMALLIIIIGGAIGGGIFLWWKFLRVVTIAEIKKTPEKFEQGVRIQGVIKSITDTQKGKVFLIADTAGEKIHVRYPYYTTTEVGDLIRVSGVIKKYKEIPYMDATELQHLTGKPTA